LTTTAKISFHRLHTVGPGVAVNLRDWGGPDPVTALLIHGVAEGGFVWDDFAPKLAEYCRVIAVDLRGHGLSDHDPYSHYTLDKHAQDVSRLLDELQIENLVLVGHSLGADVATKIAPELENSLRALVIVDSGPGSDDRIAEYLQDQLREGHRPYGQVEEYAQWLKDRRFLAEPAVLDRLAAASVVLGDDDHYRLRYDVGVIEMISAHNEDSWWFPCLHRIVAPLLVVRGMASASLSNHTAEWMCAAAPSGELAIVAAAGHAVMNDNLEGFAQAVVPFIARVCPPRQV
jgi:pimeloyl-ACP methyl ester carboxylesterase